MLTAVCGLLVVGVELCIHSTPVILSAPVRGPLWRSGTLLYVKLLVNVGHSSVGYVPRGGIAGSRDVCGQL